MFIIDEEFNEYVDMKMSDEKNRTTRLLKRDIKRANEYHDRCSYGWCDLVYTVARKNIIDSRNKK